KALIATASACDYDARLLRAVEDVNEQQKLVMFDKLMARFDGNIDGKTFALWGLSFKPNTDDMREAPSRVLMERIFEHGGQVRAYDPVAMSEARHLYPDEKRLTLMGTALDAVEGADALLINTEWREFRSPDWDRVKSSLVKPIVIDGRNIYDPRVMRQQGIDYQCIGRP
ncbi:MAG TPA: UDP-glucose 6-dehydrogenase, partial [Gammaproteobacteria bacterium]|nr:UDP-glucose 6-dehydrogenase [Gammaproteobacteria bacterium]